MYDTIKVQEGEYVGRGICEAKFGTVRTITKTQTVIEEYLALEIAHLMGVPVPPGFVARDESGVWRFVSVFVGTKEGVSVDFYDWRWDDGNFPYARKQLDRIFAFDELIGNTDRHGLNVVWTGPDRIAAIDHGFGFHKAYLAYGIDFKSESGKILLKFVNSSLLDAVETVFERAHEIFDGSLLEDQLISCEEVFWARVKAIKEEATNA